MTQFKVGDRVRCVRDVLYYEGVAPKGADAEVTLVGSRAVELSVAGKFAEAYLDEIELIPESTTETGAAHWLYTLLRSKFVFSQVVIDADPLADLVDVTFRKDGQRFHLCVDAQDVHAKNEDAIKARLVECGIRADTPHPFLPTLDEIANALGDSGWEVLHGTWNDTPAAATLDWGMSISQPYPWRYMRGDFNINLRRTTPTHIERCTVRVPGEYDLTKQHLVGLLKFQNIWECWGSAPGVTFDITREERKDAGIKSYPIARHIEGDGGPGLMPLTIAGVPAPTNGVLMGRRTGRTSPPACTACHRPFEPCRIQVLKRDARGVLQPTGKCGDCMAGMPVPLDTRIRAAEPVRARHVWEGDDLPDGNGD